MKLSVSLPSDDIEFIDAYAQDRGIDSRSAVLHRAVRLLRASELGDAYEDAWKEWAKAGEAEAWEATVSDGVEPS
jgi:Arc/MetJ-type ribon-helix-helix transcriptional regulator